MRPGDVPGRGLCRGYGSLVSLRRKLRSALPCLGGNTWVGGSVWLAVAWCLCPPHQGGHDLCPSPRPRRLAASGGLPIFKMGQTLQQSRTRLQRLWVCALFSSRPLAPSSHAGKRATPWAHPLPVHPPGVGTPSGGPALMPGPARTTHPPSLFPLPPPPPLLHPQLTPHCVGGQHHPQPPAATRTRFPKAEPAACTPRGPCVHQRARQFLLCRRHCAEAHTAAPCPCHTTNHQPPPRPRHHGQLL